MLDNKDHSNGGTFEISKIVMDYPYRDTVPYELDHKELEHEFGNKLYNLLQQVRNPVVVKIDEGVVPEKNDTYAYGYGCSMDRLYIRCTLTPVEYQHVSIPIYDYTRDHYPWEPTWRSLFRDLKTLIIQADKNLENLVIRKLNAATTELQRLARTDS